MTKALLPVLITVFASGIAWQLMANSPKTKHQPVLPQPPLVVTTNVSPQEVRIPVYTQGTVQPRTTINLASEVSGRVVETAPQLAVGGYFSKGELLLRIDPRDYQLAMSKAEAQVASANHQLAQADAEYKQKVQEYRGVDRRKVSEFALRKPQYDEALAQLKAAKAELEIAKLKLGRCEIHAPFDGRVVEKKTDVGQYEAPGNVLARIYAVDVAEIRLPLSQQQTDLLELPLSLTDNTGEYSLSVKLTGQFAGKQYSWEGEIVRTDAKISERNRLRYAIAQIKDPYGMHKTGLSGDKRPPLAMGTFVQAEIPGRLMHNVYVIPRIAVHKMTNVWLLDENMRLQVRTVKVIHHGDTEAYISEGLNPGDQVITSALDAVVEGMQLRVASSSGAAKE